VADLLDKIVENTRRQVQERKSLKSFTAIEKAAFEKSKPYNFEAALNKNYPSIIAECKKMSPSKGVLTNDYNPVQLATQYEEAGVSAISCLTDETFFGGTLADLVAIRSKTKTPLLRKDFIIDEYQIFEARAAGADSFLLLSGVLNQNQLQKFIALGRELKMEPLVESHTQDQLEAAVAAGAKILGINNRNLKTFETSLDHSLKMAAYLKQTKLQPLLVCESGIENRGDIVQMWKAGYKAFLIGETLVRADSPKDLIRLFSKPVD